MQEFKPKI